MGKYFLIAAAIFTTLVFSSQAFAQADVIEKRQQLMKGQSAAAKAIKGAVESKDYATVETKAKEIMGTAAKIVDHVSQREAHRKN